MNQAKPNAQTRCVVNLDGFFIKHQTIEGYSAKILKLHVDDTLASPGGWAAIKAAVLEHGQITIATTFHKPHNPARLLHGTFEWQLEADGVHGLMVSCEDVTDLWLDSKYRIQPIAVKNVTRITPIADIHTDTLDKIGHNEPIVSSVFPESLFPMLSIAEIDSFLNDVVRATLDGSGKRLVAKRFWLLPATDDSDERHIIFVCRPPYARYAREVYDRLQSLHAHPLIHWQIWAPSKKDHPALKLARYKERFEDQMVSDKIRLEKLLSGRNSIMAQELQTASANTRRWAGEAQWLQNPKAMAYFENILADEPMLASCYIYDAQNRITAVGARHTFNQLNQKQTADGRPTILGQTTACFDDQIRPFRERGIAELRDDNLLDIPVVLNRSYDDRTLHAEFGFRERFSLLSTGEVLEICSYVNLKDYEYWERIALMEQRKSSR